MRTLQSRGNDDAGRIGKKVRQLGPWFHNLHLPGGVQTAPDHPLGDFPTYKWEALSEALPSDLEGWRVLDIGCNAGFYSFELARRGAQVVGVDSDPHYLQQARWACEEFGLEDAVTFRQMQVYELARAAHTYDLVLFLGVFYHLRYPLLALDIVAERASKMLVFQSLSLPGSGLEERPHQLRLDQLDWLERPGWPRMAFVPGELEGDPTNCWIPNRACIESLLEDLDFHVEQRAGEDMYVCRRGASGESEPTGRAGDLSAVLNSRDRFGDSDGPSGASLTG